jgi:steroid 5-alpha reductase family enzyme
MNVAAALLIVWAGAALAQTLAWSWQQRRRNAGLVDVVWAAGVGAASVVLAMLGDGALVPRIALAVLGSVWGLRLTWHLWRRVRGEHEDGRYAALRERWGDGALRWFLLFQAQALLVVLFALPFVAVARNPVQGVNGFVWAAVLVWTVSLVGEAIADAQLARFRSRSENRGTTMRTGLWRYSRHPNYFFEWLHWFAYVLLAVGSPLWWLAWTGPVTMYVFLRWLSGIPHTERQALRTRGEDYRRYQRTTPMLFPWFPKENP